jgi:hypothetical protein
MFGFEGSFTKKASTPSHYEAYTGLIQKKVGVGGQSIANIMTS